MRREFRAKAPPPKRVEQHPFIADDERVAVCKNCGRAGCWQRVWPCEAPSNKPYLKPASYLRFQDRELEVMWLPEMDALGRDRRAAAERGEAP